MSYEIIQALEFEKKAKYLAKKYPSFKNDLADLAESLAKDPKQGVSLGHNCYKIRLAITSKGKGKSGGARVITYVVIKQQSILLLGVCDKSEMETMSDQEIINRLKKYF